MFLLLVYDCLHLYTSALGLQIQIFSLKWCWCCSFLKTDQSAAKLQGTVVNSSIYPRFEISHRHLFALIIVTRPFTVVRQNRKFKILKFDIPKFCCTTKDGSLKPSDN